MDRLRALALLTGLVAPATGQAAPGEFAATLGDPAAVFAACAGRLSAEMEHRWLMGRDPDAVTRQRATMIDLLEAAQGDGPVSDRRWLLARRIEAKAAQAALLRRASFGRDGAEVRQARATARAARRRCLSLIGQ